MTREEAIKWIIYEKDSIDTEGYCATKENYARIQALDIAIEVLSVKDCHGCTHYDLLQTPVICHDCSRLYKDRYKDEKGTLDDMFTESAEAYKAWTGEEMGGTSDLICRSDALEQMAQAECGLHYDDCEAENCSCSYIQRILDIPSADRPKKVRKSHGDLVDVEDIGKVLADLEEYEEITLQDIRHELLKVLVVTMTTMLIQESRTITVPTEKEERREK